MTALSRAWTRSGAPLRASGWRRCHRPLEVVIKVVYDEEGEGVTPID